MILGRRWEGVEPSGDNICRQAGFEDRWDHRAPSSSKSLILLTFCGFKCRKNSPLCKRFVYVVVPFFTFGQFGSTAFRQGRNSFNQPFILTLDVLSEHDVSLVA